MNSETYHYKRGSSQQFNQSSHIFDPSKYNDDQINYRYEDEIMPIVIQCVAEEGDEPRQSHMLIAVVEKNLDSTFTLKPLKQKLFVDGLCYLLQEMYGIENKNVYQGKECSDDEVEDSGSECVICMSDPRDTLILPCRHLCLCNICADSLRYQANNCPICRAPFRALLQIRAVRKCTSPPTDNQQVPPEIPPGFEPVSLIEALNGPAHTSLDKAATTTTTSPEKTPDSLRSKLKKNFRVSTSREKVRLLPDSVEIINEVSEGATANKKEDMETRSLLLVPALVGGHHSPMSLSTPHSLHLCEPTPGDATPAESDYFTPEDPAVFVVETQGAPEHENTAAPPPPSARLPLVEGSLPGTPASNASNRSSGESFSSTSSTRHLLTQTVPE
ncbi:RNF157 [Cordylochernes scorpioides]|uniref:RNF157 n=1 Tax=Cordylochernes scorpioides TaxID=51811 RepID=A0ABY6LJB9_9ARAC|nr:RNF157 [Cordylochernes scorpioides]